MTACELLQAARMEVGSRNICDILFDLCPEATRPYWEAVVAGKDAVRVVDEAKAIAKALAKLGPKATEKQIEQAAYNARQQTQPCKVLRFWSDKASREEHLVVLEVAILEACA